jgi:hypothetical protein
MDSWTVPSTGHSPQVDSHRGQLISPAMFGSFAPVLVDSSHSPKFHSLQIILVFETVLPNRFIIHILTATDCPLVSSHW